MSHTKKSHRGSKNGPSSKKKTKPKTRQAEKTPKAGCKPVSGSGVMDGWGCHVCMTYNGNQRISCKRCGHTRCGEALATVHYKKPGGLIAHVKCAECGVSISNPAQVVHVTDSHKAWSKPPEGYINCKGTRGELRKGKKPKESVPEYRMLRDRIRVLAEEFPNLYVFAVVLDEHGGAAQTTNIPKHTIRSLAQDILDNNPEESGNTTIGALN